MADTKYSDFHNALSSAGSRTGSEELIVMQGGVPVRTGLRPMMLFTPSTAAATDPLAVYSSGTWTPALTASTVGDLTVSYTTQTGIWHRSGNMLFLRCDIACTPTFTTATGSLMIAGLTSPAIPAGSQSRMQMYHNAALAYSSGYTWAYIFAQSSGFYVRQLGSAKAEGNVAITALTSGTAISLGFSGVIYLV